MNSTDPSRKHEYNVNGPSGFLITFGAYGAWLHGDERGSVERNVNNIPGTPIIETNLRRIYFEKGRLKYPKVTFDIKQRSIIDQTIKNVAPFNKWLLHAVNARSSHVHIVITASKSPDLIMNSLKSWCTRALNNAGLWNRECSPWARHGSTRYLWDEKSVVDATNYVLYCQD